MCHISTFRRHRKHLRNLIKVQIAGPPLTDMLFTRSGVNPRICILIKPTEWIRCFINFILKISFLMHLSLRHRNIFNPPSVWVNYEWQMSVDFLKGAIISLSIEGLFMLLYEMNSMLNLGDIEQFLFQGHCS